jgi:hypothetical protein
MSLARHAILSGCAAVVVAMAGIPVAADAQPTPTAPGRTVATTPESIATAYSAAMRRADWPAAAAFMHPDALGRLRTLFEPLVQEERTGAIGMAVFAVKDVAEFRALPEAERFTRLMRFFAAQTPQLKTMLAATETVVIGHVREGVDTAHVVTRARTSTGIFTVDKTSVLSMRRSEGGWGILLSGDIEGLATALRARSGP